MKARRMVSTWASMLICVGPVPMAGAVLAAGADSDRGTSVYDQNPDCMNRGELKDGQAVPADCTIANGPPHRHVVGATKPVKTGKSAGTGGGTQKAVPASAQALK